MKKMTALLIMCALPSHIQTMETQTKVSTKEAVSNLTNRIPKLKRVDENVLYRMAMDIDLSDIAKVFTSPKQDRIFVIEKSGLISIFDGRGMYVTSETEIPELAKNAYIKFNEDGTEFTVDTIEGERTYSVL